MLYYFLLTDRFHFVFHFKKVGAQSVATDMQLLSHWWNVFNSPHIPRTLT